MGLYADSHLFAMQKQWRYQRSDHVLRWVGCAGEQENHKPADAEIKSEGDNKNKVTHTEHR